MTGIDYWTELWAFGTSQYGLGLSDERLWSLTLRQHAALKGQWRDHHKIREAMFAQLRADIHNSSEMLQRRDKRRWEAADFGAEVDKRRWKDPRKHKLTPAELQRRIIAGWGPEGRGQRGPQRMPAVEAMKGKGQPLPLPKEA